MYMLYTYVYVIYILYVIMYNNKKSSIILRWQNNHCLKTNSLLNDQSKN